MKNETIPYLVNENGTLPSDEKPKVANPLKVGDVIVGSYGYEASISEFYEVTARKGQTVTLRSLKTNRTYRTGGMEWTSMALPGCYESGPITKRVKERGGVEYVKFDLYGCWLWDGEVRHDYNYH